MLLASCWRAACMAFSHDCGAAEWRGLAGLWKQCKKLSASAWRFNCSRSLAKAAFMAWVVSINMLECHVTSNLPYQEQYFQKVFLFSCSVASSEQVNHGETCQKHHKLWVFNILFQSWNWIIFHFLWAFSLLTDAMSCSCARPCSGLPDLTSLHGSRQWKTLSSALCWTNVQFPTKSSLLLPPSIAAVALQVPDKKKQNWPKIYVNIFWGFS